MDSLEINEDAPKYAAKVINRRPIITLDDSDDGSCSETPETFKTKHMQEEEVGRLRKNVPQYQVEKCRPNFSLGFEARGDQSVACSKAELHTPSGV